MSKPKNRIELIEQIRELPELEEYLDKNKDKYVYANKSGTGKQRKLSLFFSDVYAKQHLGDVYTFWKKELRASEEKWEQFLRLALYHYDKMQFMYARTNSLLVKHDISNKNYFKIRLHNTICELPDTLYQFIMLDKVCKKFFKIYKMIERRFSFDNMNRNYISKKIHGKVDWMETLKDSKYSVPQHFQINSDTKDFFLSENTLLAFTLYKIYEITRIYSGENRGKQLSNQEREILGDIQKKVKRCMNNFPHDRVLDGGKTLSKFGINSHTVMEILKKCQKQKNSFQNNGYKLFLEWFDEFSDIHYKINHKTSQINYINEASKNFDTMFEVWVLMELYDTAYHKFGITNNVKMGLKDGKEFEFMVHGNKCVLEYDKRSKVGENSPNWATESRPDYLIKSEGVSIAVFDAKNTKQRGDPNHKVLGYMTNYECDLGGAIYSITQPEYTNERINKSHKKKFCSYELDLKKTEKHRVVLDKIFSDVELCVQRSTP